MAAELRRPRRSRMPCGGGPAATALLLWMLAFLPAPSVAQDLDSTATIAAEMVASVDAAARRCERAVLAGPDGAVYREQLSGIQARRSAARASVRELRAVADGEAGLLLVARGRRTDARIFGADLGDAGAPAARLRALLEVYETYWGSALREVVPADSVPVYERPIDRFRSADLEAALARNLARIRRYEIKYGPGSANLNLLETLLNFGAQRIPPLRPGKNGISPFEVVANYTTSYVTVVDGEATAMSSAEFGLRLYNWRYHDTPSNVAQAFVPRYWTVALAVGAREDGALEWPWDAKPRLGPAVSWGELKLAYLHAKKDDWRLIVSRQFQFLPHLL